ncbi:MAG: hypothetical protein L3J12_07915, partial [Spirochaetales bacterium]|nr:hypothetical protein [Spirochaetales bacterium]
GDSLSVQGIFASDILSGIDNNSWEVLFDSDLWQSFVWDITGYTQENIPEKSFDITALGGGDHSITLRVRDYAGNLITGITETFIKDNIPPVLENLSLYFESYQDSFNNILRLNMPLASDAESGINNNSWQYRFDNTSEWISFVLADLIEISLPESFIEGEHIFSVRVNDSNNNSSEKSVSFNIDRISPDITNAVLKIYYLENNVRTYIGPSDYIGNDRIYAEITGMNEEAVLRYEFNITNSEPSSLNLVSEINDFILPEQTADISYLFIRAVDGAGNISSDVLTRIIKLDSNIPDTPIIIGLTHPSAYVPGDAVSETTAVFNINAGTSTQSGISGFKYVLKAGINPVSADNSAELDSGIINQYQLTLDNLDDNGSNEYYFLYLWTISGSGIKSSVPAVYQFRIDSLPPDQLTINSPSHPQEDFFYSMDTASLKWLKPGDITGVEAYYVKFQTFIDGEPGILTNGIPGDLSDWTVLTDDTVDYISYDLSLQDVVKTPGNPEPLFGSVAFAVCAVDFAGNRQFDERVVRYDIESPSFNESVESISISITGDTVLIDWPDAGADGSDVSRYLISIDTYLNDTLENAGNWIVRSSSDYNFVGISNDYTYKVTIGVEDGAIPANTDSMYFEFNASGDLTIPTEQPFSSSVNGYRIWGLYDSASSEGTANLEFPGALDITSGLLTNRSLLLENSLFSEGSFISGSHSTVNFFLQSNVLSLNSTGIDFSIETGLKFNQALLNRRVSSADEMQFIFNNLSIDSAFEGSFVYNSSVPQTVPFTYQYQNSIAPGVYQSEGWLLENILVSRLSGTEWGFQNSIANVKDYTGFEFFKDTPGVREYGISVSDTSLTGEGKVLYGTLYGYPYNLELGDTALYGSMLEIRNKLLLCHNVIEKVFFEIPLEQTCLPGLHMTLGIFMKMLTVTMSMSNY